MQVLVLTFPAGVFTHAKKMYTFSPTTLRMRHLHFTNLYFSIVFRSNTALLPATHIYGSPLPCDVVVEPVPVTVHFFRLFIGHCVAYSEVIVPPLALVCT